jgi:hypothetical protein
MFPPQADSNVFESRLLSGNCLISSETLELRYQIGDCRAVFLPLRLVIVAVGVVMFFFDDGGIDLLSLGCGRWAVWFLALE